MTLKFTRIRVMGVNGGLGRLRGLEGLGLENERRGRDGLKGANHQSADHAADQAAYCKTSVHDRSVTGKRKAVARVVSRVVKRVRAGEAGDKDQQGAQKKERAEAGFRLRANGGADMGFGQDDHAITTLPTF